MVQVKIKKLDPNATIPTSGSAFAAGYDLYACLSGDGEVTIPAHHTVMVPTGIAVELPEGTFGGVFARTLPVPMTIVPGDMSKERLEAIT